jgi:hypothetical protein
VYSGAQAPIPGDDPSVRTIRSTWVSTKKCFGCICFGQAEFPASMLLYFVVCSDSFSQNRFYTPSKSSHPGNTTTHAFQARGLNFFLMTGDDITETMGSLCLMTDDWRRQMDYGP